jgi:hypothetical protein
MPRPRTLPTTVSEPPTTGASLLVPIGETSSQMILSSPELLNAIRDFLISAITPANLISVPLTETGDPFWNVARRASAEYVLS